MRKLILILALLFTGIWIYTIIINISTQTTFNIPFFEQITTKTAWILLGFGVFTAIIDGLACIWYLKTKTELNKNYQLKMDKLSVQSDSDKSQIKILENKIKTLETALEKLTKKD